MSQPPSMPPYGYPQQPGYAPQYAFWPYYSAPPDELLAPARRAGWVLIGLGIAGLLLGTCVGVFATQMSENDLAPALAQLRAQPAARDGQVTITAQTVRIIYAVMFGGVGLAGLVGIGLGALVRTGHRVWLVLGLVACAALSLFLLLVLASGFGSGGQVAVAVLATCAVPIAATIVAIKLLLQAMRNASTIDAARHHAAYAAHYGAPPPPQA